MTQTSPKPTPPTDFYSLQNMSVRVVARLTELAKAEYNEGRGNMAWYVLDDFDQWQLIERQLDARLSDLGIDRDRYVIDLDSSPPAIVCMVKLWQAFREAEQRFEYGGLELWRESLQFQLGEIGIFFTIWAERRSESRRRATISGKGSKARGEKKADWKAEAIKLFDPGPEAGSKSHRSRIIRKRAIENGFKDAEKLPQRLDKYLS